MNRNLGLLFCVTVFMFMVACKGSKNDSPVDVYLGILDEEIELIQDIDRSEKLQSINPKIARLVDDNPVIMANRDYRPTQEEKDKIKEKNREIVKLTLEKTIEYGDLTEEEKKVMESKIKDFQKASDIYIDRSSTLGQITV